MGADNRGIDQGVFVGGVGREVLEHPRPHPAPTPAHMPRMNHAKIPKPSGEVAPGNPGPIAVQNRFPKPAVILHRAPHMARSPRQQCLNPLPLVIP